MIPDIHAVLSGSGALTAIVGQKIFRTAAPETLNSVRVEAPYVVWSIVDSFPENNLSELPETDNSRIEIDCYSKSQAQSKAMCDAAQAAIEAVTHIIAGPLERKEDDTKLWCMFFDASFWTDR